MKKLFLFTVISFTLFSCNQKEILFHPGDDSSFIFQTGADFGHRTVEVFYHIPEGKVRNMDVIFVLHGTNRNGDEYFEWTKEASRKYPTVLLSPVFTSDLFPTRDYQSGGIKDANNNYNTPEKMTYKIIDDIFEHLVKYSNLKTKHYNIIGHSAGGQFVHRFMLFSDSPYVKTGVASNAGVYTFPDEKIEFPYGMEGYTTDPKSLRKRYYSRDLTIFLGTADTIRDRNFPAGPQADLQGLTRFERGQNFFNRNKKVAENEGAAFNWKMDFIEGVGHAGNRMMPEAVEYIYKNLR